MQKPALDAAAKAYMAILSDPCGAELAHPLYSGTGGGYLLRTRQLVDINPTSGTAFVFECTPNVGNGVGSAGFIRWSWSNTAGGALGTPTLVGLPSFLKSTQVRAFRAVAACAKVRFVGQEISRSGLIGTSLFTGSDILGGAPITVSADVRMSTMQRTDRTGTVDHEIRWAPAAQDEFWNTRPDDQTDITHPPGNSMQIVGVNLPGNISVTIEVTVVWEWQPNMDVDYGVPQMLSTPRSMNTMNQVLSQFGDLVSWATNPATIAKTRRIFGSVMSAASAFKYGALLAG